MIKSRFAETQIVATLKEADSGIQPVSEMASLNSEKNIQCFYIS